MGDSLHRENARYPSRCVGVLVVSLTGDDMNVIFMPKRFEILPFDARHIIHRLVEVPVFVVVIALVITADIKRAAHRYASRKKIGAPEKLIRAMERSETCACGDDSHAPLTAIPDEGHHFAGDIAVVLHLTKRLVTRMQFIVEPALAIDAVDREDFHLAGFD